MKFIRAYRIDGTMLSVRFGKDGALSTAIHVHQGQQRNAAPQLPGLREENAEAYLAAIGYAQRFPPECVEVARLIDPMLAPSDMQLETVQRHESGFLLSVVHRHGAAFVCPIRLFLAVYDRAHDALRPLDVHDEGAMRQFARILRLTILPNETR